MKPYIICTIGGDGVGPEVVQAATQILKHTEIQFQFIEAEAGFNAYEKYDTPLPQETIDKCNKADAILFGAVTTPPHIENYKSPIIQLRRQLHLFANVRPIFSLPIKESRKNIDIVLFRENTEDLYAGQEKLTPEGAIAERVITKKASEQIIQYAFEYAVQKNRKKITLIHKSNVLRLTDGLFLQTGINIAKKYPQIIFEDMLVDSCAMQLIKKPEQFDILVTTNMFGDILSDEAAALVGGLGVAASGNVGEKTGLFEPVHGSAPKYTGKNTINPTACILASCMMLEFLKEHKTAQAIRAAVIKTLEKTRTQDLGGAATTSEFTSQVIHNL